MAVIIIKLNTLFTASWETDNSLMPAHFLKCTCVPGRQAPWLQGSGRHLQQEFGFSSLAQISYPSSKNKNKQTKNSHGDYFQDLQWSIMPQVRFQQSISPCFTAEAQLYICFVFQVITPKTCTGQVHLLQLFQKRINC